MKKQVVGLLSGMLILSLTACGNTPDVNADSSQVISKDRPDIMSEDTIDPCEDWKAYDALIEDIKMETDFAQRAEKMHRAEDILMSTGAIVPLYYYNDGYMQKPDVQGIYSNNYGFKYFMYATNGEKDSMNLCLSSEPPYMDPALNTSIDGSCMIINCFSGLYRYNAQGEIVPDLAVNCEKSEDNLKYVFKIKDNLKWSDGTTITAEDFVYSWNRVIAKETASDYNYMFSMIDGFDTGKLNVTATDELTLEVVLNTPCAYFLDLLAQPVYVPVQKNYVETNSVSDEPGSWAHEAGYVTSGAYYVSEWNHNESITLTKNPYYWDADNVKLEKLHFMLSSDITAAYWAYEAGDLDFTDYIPVDETKNLVETQSPEFHIVDQLGTYYLIFNVKSDLFAGKTVEQATAMRLAFSYLIDRDYIVDTIAQCGQQIATSFIPARMQDGNGKEFKNKDYYYDADNNVEIARELLQYAGYEFGEDGKLKEQTPLCFNYLTNDISANIAIAEAIQADLSSVGIQMNIAPEEWNVFLEDRKSGNYSVARAGWMTNFNDPISMLEMWTTTSSNNDVQFGR